MPQQGDAPSPLTIDNNLVENAIRHTALGKNNWLFMGDADAAERGAILYTLIACCRRRGLDPYTYLKDVLNRLPIITNHQIHPRRLGLRSPSAAMAGRSITLIVVILTIGFRQPYQ